MIEIFDVMPAALFYVPGTSDIDDSLPNKINSIVKQELDEAFETISKKVSAIE